MGNLTINNGGIVTNSTNLPNIDLRYGPYRNTSEAYRVLGSTITPGLTVGIMEEGEIKEYIVNDSHQLTPKLKLRTINNRDADIAVTGELKSLGYKVLNPAINFTNQVTEENTVYEIRDYFDLSGTEQSSAIITIPANCKLRFEGGMLGGNFCTLQGNNTLIESDSVCIKKDIKIAGTWGNNIIFTRWLEFISAKDAYIPASVGTEGVMAPFFEDNIFYKYGKNYELLSVRPNDWTTEWSKYYEIVNNVYVQVSDIAPEYAANVYYRLTEDGVYEKLTSDDPPDDWETNYMDYYTDNNGTHVVGTFPEFVENVYYENAGEGYEKILQQPDDWFANWSNYYIKVENSYITPDGIIDNPNATNNALVFKQLQAFINGTKGCKVEFEKGYYQAATLGEARGTATIDNVDYEMWPTNLYSRDADVILNIFDLPYLDINLNGAKIKALRTNSPTWQLIRCNGVENLSIHDGELEGYANRFNYPQYWDRDYYPNGSSGSGTISTNYERVWLLMVAGGNCELYNLNIHNSTGNCVSVGKRLWKSGSNIKSYDLKSAYIHDCEFYDCGRNGMGMGNGEYVTLERLHIHHVGSSGGKLTKDPDTNIMGYLPMVGIDIESDEIKTSNPIVKWDSLRIHNCSSAAFAFAPASKSLMTSFYAYNLSIEGRCATETITTIEGLPKFESCFFEVTDSTGNADNYFRGKAIYERCTFVLKHFISAAKNTFINCIFKDEIDGDPSNVRCIKKASYDKSFYHTFQGCTLELKHSCYLDKSIIDNCEIVFKETDYVSSTSPLYTVRLNGSTLVNTTVRAINTARVRITSNSDGYGSGIDFINCNFINIRGNVSGSSYNSAATTPFETLRGILHFDKCKFEENNKRLAVYVGKDDSAKCFIENSYVKYSTLIFGSSDSTNDKAEAVISNTECGYLVLRLCHNISINKSSFSTPEQNYIQVNNLQIDDCVAKFNYPTSSSYYSYDNITIENSVITFNSNSYNNVTTITTKNSYIKGNGISELLYKGKVNNCKFETSVESSGNTRPSIRTNANIGFRFFDTTLNKPIYWNGTAWVDGNGEDIGLQVSDTSVLMSAAADSSATINVYHTNALNVSAINPDNTTATWLTVPSTIAIGTDTLTITANSANTTNPRSAQVIIEDGVSVVIVNVVQNYT